MMKDVTMELAQILMVKVCHQGVVIFSKIPPLTKANHLKHLVEQKPPKNAEKAMGNRQADRHTGL